MRPSPTRLDHRFQLRVASLLALAALAAGALVPTAVAAPPAGFSYQDVASGWVDAVGTTFTSSGRMLVWERAGRVWTVDNGIKSATPFIDLSNEVGSWGDHGLLGFALHPNFKLNGYVYLLYVVDRDHLLNCDASIHDPSCSETTTNYASATIGRITRYQANLPTGATDYASATSVDPLSRTVILGQTADSGCPILFQSHGVGGLLFGADETLFATCGDGASDVLVDTGSSLDTYWEQALTETSPPIMLLEENVGAYRAQMVNSLSGKLIRIDPMTGDGVSTNPWYDPQAPRAPPSRVWSLGLRDPFRIALVPGSGSDNPNDGTPGVLLIGDAGLKAWQEFNVARFGGDNFGSPRFEGMDPHPGYSSAITFDRDAPNPLFGTGGCTQQYFSFQDLIGSYGSLPLKNPCDGVVDIPSTIPTHTHQKPEIDWSYDTATARWSNATGQHFDVGTNGVSGTMFSGRASTSGVWYAGTDFPASYRNTYFHADSATGWIRRFVLDANGRIQSELPFDDAAGPVVDMSTSPTDGSLYVVLRNGGVKRVVYNAGEQMQVPLGGQVVRLDVVNDAGDLAPGLANPNAPPVVLFMGSPLEGAAP
ncbi:MAG TPA: PQQ-dependent sugar dehydrogenase, partial [Pseudomonadales bacterium]